MANRHYDYAKLYQLRKEAKLKKVELDERSRRHRVAQPMPNFNENPITVKASPDLADPQTPEVLKRSLQTKEKLMKKQEDFVKKQNEQPPIVARSADVLQAVPFKPILEQKGTTVEPFDLTLLARLKERKNGDIRREQEKALREAKIAKDKQEEDEILRKIARKQTIFKARPNPFK